MSESKTGSPVDQNLLVKRDSLPAQEVTPSAVLSSLMASGADPGQLMKMMELQTIWEEKEARKAFVVAMSGFKANPPTIKKNKNVEYGNTKYSHASLDHASDEIGKALSEHGLSHRWNVEQLDGGMIKVTCILMHSMGHSESVSMQSGADTSGAKNNIQGIGSTITYLERYTLLAATGMATEDQDDDGGDPIQLITKDQENEIHAYITENEKSDSVMKWLKSKGINSLSDIPADKFNTIMKKVKA